MILCMGKWAHRLDAIDSAAAIATCAACGPDSPIVWREYKQRWQCRVARREHHGPLDPRRGVRPWRKHKKDHCERCGLVPEDLCVLEVDHIDGRRIEKPHHPSNLQTLCANCHKLKTHRPDLFALPATPWHSST